MFLVPNIDQMYKEMKKIVEVGNGDEFQKKKKSRPTDPNFEDHAIGNTHIFFFGLTISHTRLLLGLIFLISKTNS
jgi:hypothetical protein